MAFPPRLYNIEHVGINSTAQEELALRAGISSVIIPNVLDFECPPQVDTARTQRFRDSLGLATGDVVILQPTRIVQRKGIEHAIELVRELKSRRYKLVISHEAGDEGYEYAKWVKSEAGSHGVDLRIVKARIADPLNENASSNRGMTLWDVYPHADFITYPSLYEGFGNAFLEAIYFKKPMLINRYATFVKDIEPQGFDLAVMDGYLTKKTVKKVQEVLKSSERRRQMVEHNLYDRQALLLLCRSEQSLAAIIVNFFGAKPSLIRRTGRSQSSATI
jgi:glycosyltransferase involved in cell wall biosynthesis